MSHCAETKAASFPNTVVYSHVLYTDLKFELKKTESNLQFQSDL